MPPQDTADSVTAERAVVAQFLQPTTTRTAAELYAAIHEPGVGPPQIDAALSALLDAGVLRRAANERLCASRALAHLDRLALFDV